MTKGFWQLIDRNGVIVRQREGDSDSESYMRSNVWLVPSDMRLHFTIESEFIEPWKFFGAHKKGTLVTIYNQLVDTDEHIDIVNKIRSLDEIQPHLGVEIKSFEILIDDIDKFTFDHKDFQVWNAYIGKEWVGTSEY